MTTDSRILVKLLQQYAASLEKHINQLNLEYRKLERAWNQLNPVIHGNYADEFRPVWLRTKSRFNEYINGTGKILNALKNKIDYLEQFNRGEPLFSLPSGQIISSQFSPRSNVLPGAGSIPLPSYAESLTYEEKDFKTYSRIEPKEIDDCFIAFSIENDNKVKILYIQVPDKYQKKGVATHLYHLVESKLKKGTVVYFDEIDNEETNDKAVKFWNKTGFNKKGNSRGYEKVV